MFINICLSFVWTSSYTEAAGTQVACTYLPGHVESLSLVKKISSQLEMGFLASFSTLTASGLNKEKNHGKMCCIHPCSVVRTLLLKKKKSSPNKISFISAVCIVSTPFCNCLKCWTMQKEFLTVISFHLMYSIRLLLWKDFIIFYWVIKILQLLYRKC